MVALLFNEGLTYATELDAEEATTETPKTTEYPEGSGQAPDLVSDSAIVIDADSGQILYQKDAYSTRYPASITKIMTALLALENGDLTSTVTFSENAIWGIERDSTHIALDVGEQLTLEQALYATLVVSANEAAWGVAEHIGGTLENFANMMNEKAAELGCVNTHFVNANGLHDDDHYTCAYDMALIAREAIKIDKFREITSTTYYEIPPTNLQEETRYLYQDNKLIKQDSDYYYEPCIGGKTGFTDQALGTLVAWAEQDGRTLICVVMHARPTRCTYTDATALFKYCFSNLSYQYPFEDFAFTQSDIDTAQSYLAANYADYTNGNLTLSSDINSTGIYVKDDISYSTEFVCDDSQLDDGIIGYLSIKEQDMQITTVPVYFYIEAITTATQEASPAISSENQTSTTVEEKKERKTISVNTIIIIVAAVLIIAIIGLILRIKYVRYKREEYIRRRNEARRKGKPF
jgi:D-alanyl-D-alanine carboxypeptidase